MGKPQVEIPLSGGDYNGLTLVTLAGVVSPGDYIRIERIGITNRTTQDYLLHSNGVARHDPHHSGHAILFAEGEVQM